MVINYCSFLHPRHYYGGGELCMQELLDIAEGLGYRVNYVTVKPSLDEFDEKADLTIICDIFNEPQSVQKFPIDRLKRIIRSSNYIHIDCSYVDVCNVGHLPCMGVNSEFCLHKRNLSFIQKIRRRDLSYSCFNYKKIVKELYNNSLMNVFLSPLHERIITKLLNLHERSYVVKPLIKAGRFTNNGSTRDIEYLYVGSINKSKGLKNLVTFFSERQAKLVMIGKSDIDLSPYAFIDYYGPIPHDEIPTYFNRAVNFVHLPEWPEPMGRTVLEAALCGCNLITNENVGACSFDFDITDSENYLNSGQLFWQMAEGTLLKSGHGLK